MNALRMTELTEKLGKMMPKDHRVGFRNRTRANGNPISSILIFYEGLTAEMVLGDQDTDCDEIYQQLCVPAIACIQSQCVEPK